VLGRWLVAKAMGEKVAAAPMGAPATRKTSHRKPDLPGAGLTRDRRPMPGVRPGGRPPSLVSPREGGNRDELPASHQQSRPVFFRTWSA